jgi:hypothetical protein
MTMAPAARRAHRPIVDFDRPDVRAIDARDQCVALVGVSSNVDTTTCSTWSRVIDGGRPGRSSSTRPSRRSATNRERHLPTVGRDTRKSSAAVVTGVVTVLGLLVIGTAACVWAAHRHR